MGRLDHRLNGFLAVYVLLAASTHAQFLPPPGLPPLLRPPLLRPPLLRPPPLGQLCAVTTCPVGSTCRVVKPCQGGPLCIPRAMCLPCKPTGVDFVCNSRQYYFAVLVGNVNNPLGLTARHCNPQLADVPPNCPFGSTCVPDAYGRGVCCYGRPLIPPPFGGIVSNAQPVCQNLCGPCPPGYVCEQFPGPVFICVKDGDCPSIVPDYNSIFCPRPPLNQCAADVNCLGLLKCCPNSCGTLQCLVPTSD